MVRRPVRRYRRSGSRALISGSRDVQLVDLRRVCDLSAAKSKERPNDQAVRVYVHRCSRRVGLGAPCQARGHRALVAPYQVRDLSGRAIARCGRRAASWPATSPSRSVGSPGMRAAPSPTREQACLPLVKRARSIWSVHPKNKRQLLLTTDAEVELKGGYFGRLLEPVMAAVFRRMAPSSLAEFKYLVENGHPYQGRHSNPPAAAATC
jgi:hypothetical protein